MDGGKDGWMNKLNDTERGKNIGKVGEWDKQMLGLGEKIARQISWMDGWKGIMRELKKGRMILEKVKKEHEGKGNEWKFQCKGNFLMVTLVSEMWLDVSLEFLNWIGKCRNSCFSKVCHETVQWME